MRRQHVKQCWTNWSENINSAVNQCDEGFNVFPWCCPVCFCLGETWWQLARCRSHPKCFVGGVDGWSHMVDSVTWHTNIGLTRHAHTHTNSPNPACCSGSFHCQLHLKEGLFSDWLPAYFLAPNWPVLHVTVGCGQTLTRRSMMKTMNQQSIKQSSVHNEIPLTPPDKVPSSLPYHTHMLNQGCPNNELWPTAWFKM